MLSNIRLSKIRLSNIRLCIIRLRNIRLSNIRLSNIRLSIIRLNNIRLSNIRLSNIRLCNIRLSNISLRYIASSRLLVLFNFQSLKLCIIFLKVEYNITMLNGHSLSYHQSRDAITSNKNQSIDKHAVFRMAYLPSIIN